jgi:2-keto-4-pentenoate hydratase/2-oxohepta-3-ene-1,7-dioic acid hydratase in catechol pathway
MHDGDRVEVEIENIGRLMNTIVEAQPQPEEFAV